MCCLISDFEPSIDVVEQAEKQKIISKVKLFLCDALSSLTFRYIFYLVLSRDNL